MDTKHFLTRVFAQRDELVICTHVPDRADPGGRGIFWNRGSFSDIDAAVSAISAWDAEPSTTVYFGVGAFAGHSYTASNGKAKWYRKAEFATWFKALALDLDIGQDKPYASQRDGWKALHGALVALGIPTPMVVSSGRGIHCYWPLTEPVSRAHWERASIALRLALASAKVEIDTTKIHDPSMVLRPVGTHHKKAQPWKLVECRADCPDHDPVALFTALRPWVGKGGAPATRPNRPRPASGIAAAVFSGNDVNIRAVGAACRQVGALLASGGATDATGAVVAEPLWRASLGLAKYATDQREAVVMLAGAHPTFDMAANLDKLARWSGTGPTTCATFEKLCAAGCAGCPQAGRIRSPAQLSSAAPPDKPPATAAVDFTLPDGYLVLSGSIYREVAREEETVGPNGVVSIQQVIEHEFVSSYEMHITGVYNDPVSRKSSFKLLINYPMVGWVEEDHEIAVLASTGKDFSTFLLNRQVYVKAVGQQEKLRGYLMDYLAKVQKLAPSGVDFVSFGWQPDGSFLCGEHLINSPTGNVDRRLRGPAARFAEIIKPHGARDAWVAGMKMLDQPGTQTIRSAILLATAGVLGRAAGNASLVVSIYSTETTTGKTLALIAANSLIGSPRELFLNKNDTANALFKVRGVLNHLPCTIDELTTADDADVADLAYDLSQGREKIAMTKDRELREPARWDGPTLLTTNISIHQKFDMVQANNDPLKARTLELEHSDRTFIQTDESGSSAGYRFFDIVAENNGWAMPELVEAVVALGGDKAVWEQGERAFNKRFGFLFEPQERFYRTGIVSAWIMGSIGKRLGLFPFDVDATVRHLLDHVEEFRGHMKLSKLDAFDVIGQFLQEHNDELIEVSEVYGTNKEIVQDPIPQRAVARIKVVSDKQNPVLPGSALMINYGAFRKWLARSRDGVDRIVRELQAAGALISERERVTLFKGCRNRNPGQAHCLVVNLNHLRFADAITSTAARPVSTVALAVIQSNQAKASA